MAVDVGQKSGYVGVPLSRKIGLCTYGRNDVQRAGNQYNQKRGTTAILLNRITLLAVVGGNEVANPFEVTEVYVQENGKWKLGSMSFTRLINAPN